MSGGGKEKLIRQIYQDGLHEFLVKVDFAKLDPALFVKAMRSAQKRTQLGHGAVVIEHVGRLVEPKVAAP